VSTDTLSCATGGTTRAPESPLTRACGVATVGIAINTSRIAEIRFMEPLPAMKYRKIRATGSQNRNVREAHAFVSFKCPNSVGSCPNSALVPCGERRTFV